MMSTSREIVPIGGIIKNEVSKHLSGLLECPVCLNVLTPPISQCKNGHNICSTCLPNISRCPICREVNMGNRNILADQLVSVCMFSCQNNKYGCKETLPIMGNKEHILKCPYRIYKCLLAQKNNCTWNGRYGELKIHILENHSNELYEDEYSKIEKYGNWSTNGSFIFAQGEIFISHLRVEKDSEKLYVAMIYVGTEENAKYFWYVVELSNNDGARKIIHYCVTHADYININDIFKTRNCFRVDMNVASQFEKIRIRPVAPGTGTVDMSWYTTLVKATTLVKQLLSAATILVKQLLTTALVIGKKMYNVYLKMARNKNKVIWDDLLFMFGIISTSVAIFWFGSHVLK